MSTFGKNNMRRVPAASLRVGAGEHPDWPTGLERLPAIGERVHCTEGIAEVVRVLGKTSDGSRLLELALPDRPRQPFFAAASNVLVSPEPAPA